jgi:hypothetical protein
MPKLSFSRKENEIIYSGSIQMSLIPMQNQKQKTQEDNEVQDQKRFRTKKLGKRNFTKQREQKRNLEENGNEKYR